MSEAATATIESSRETEEERLFKLWEPTLKEHGTDANLRDAIMGRIKEGEEPRGELTQAELRKMSKEQIDKKFSQMTQKLVIRKPEDLNIVDDILDAYSDRVKGVMGELGDDSVPPGEVLREREKEKESWAEYGWSDDEKKKVKEDLNSNLSSLKLNDDQLNIMLEIFLAEGKKPSELTDPKIKKISTDIKSEWDSDPNLRRDWKNDPEIFLMHKLGIDEKQIKHFIMTDKFVSENDYEIDYSTPKNIEELAWQMIHTPGKSYSGWGVRGDFPLLEMRIVKYEKDDEDGHKKGEINTEKSRYRVNTANMVRWARYNMYTAYDLDRETPHDFFKEIALKKRYPLSLQEMLLNPKQYFVSEDGIGYEQLLLEWYKEAAVMTTVRVWDCAYRGVAGDPDELAKVFKEIYNTQNLLTRGALGSNIINLMATMPLDFEGRKDGHWPSDSVMGAAWMDIYRAYDSMSDFEGLQRVLGSGSKFFTRAGIAEGMREVAKENIAATGVDKIRVFMGEEYYGYFVKAFDKDGEISTPENKKNFIKFISIFGPKMIGGKVEWTVRAALRSAIAEKYGSEIYVKNSKNEIFEQVISRDLYNKVYAEDPMVEVQKGYSGDGVKVRFKKHAFTPDQGKKEQKIEERVEDMDSLKIAEAIAWSLVKPFGAGAKNDPDGIGHDWMTRVYQTQLMRQKYPHRGDKFGNEFTMMQFKRTGIDALNAIVTEAPTEERDEQGRVIYKIDKDSGEKKPINRQKTIMEVMVELSDFKTTAVKKLRVLEKELEDLTLNDSNNTVAIQAKKKEIEDHNKSSDQNYQNLAQQMSFGQRTLSNYWEDHLHYGMDLYRQLVSAEEIPFEKFTEYTPFGGVRFKQAEFSAEIQDKWIHKIRYMIDTYPSLNFNQTVRVLDQTETSSRHWGPDHRSLEPAYHEVKLGEAMFGHEMLNRAEFWKRDDHGNPVNMRDKKGRKIKGMYEIDYQRVQDEKQLVWKQWFMMKVAGDLYAHRALHANEPRFNLTYYQNVVESIGRIPGNILQNEYSIKDTHVNKYFFNKADIAWLKKTATVENFDLYWRAMLKDVFMDDKPEEGIGLILALSLAMKAIIEQKV